MRCSVHIDDLRPIPGEVAKCKVRSLTVVSEVDELGHDLAA
jgi:hypothetical protein